MICKTFCNRVRSPFLPHLVGAGLLLIAGLSIPEFGFASEVHHPSVEGAAFPYNPPNRGAPGETRDAGSRPLCPEPEKPFTAIAPFTNWGETTQSHPTFWLYIPYAAGNVEFFLRDEQTQTEVYRTVFTLEEGEIPEGGGIRGFEMPVDAPPLAVDTVYNWQFDFICNPESRSKFRTSGMVIRRSPSAQLQEQLASSSSLETVFVYAEAGFWYDALASLAQLQQRPIVDVEVSQTWIDLLEHPVVDLTDLSTTPILSKD